MSAKGKHLGRKPLLDRCTIFSPDTILRLHREMLARKHDYCDRRSKPIPLKFSDVPDQSNLVTIEGEGVPARFVREDKTELYSPRPTMRRFRSRVLVLDDVSFSAAWGIWIRQEASFLAASGIAWAFGHEDEIGAR